MKNILNHISEKTYLLLRLSCVIAVVCCLSTATSYAFGYGEDSILMNEPEMLVKEIKIDGVQRLEKETILSYLTFSTGSNVGELQLDASLKSLYATGLFKDVSLTLKENTVFIEVEENPIVNRIAFENNDNFSDKDLKKEIQLRPRHVYTLPKVQKDVQRLLGLYRRSGRFAATVDPKIVKLDQNRIDIIFEIVEGKRTGVRNIKFIGNKKYDENDLKSVISTEESKWWAFFSSSDFYDPDRTQYDKDLLRKFYMNEGYIDFRVVSAVAEIMPDRSDLFLTFTVDEGNRYKFGNVDVKSEIKGINQNTLIKYVYAHNNDWYSANAVERSINKMTAVLGDKQYAFVDIMPKIKKDKKKSIIDVTFVIKPGEQSYIGRIDITGNSRTYDKVIRREMMLAEGDPFSTSKIKRSEQKIRDLGYFKDVKVSTNEGAQPDRSNVEVKVEEKSTGEVSFGAGFSSSDGPLGDFSVRERNFLGKGQDVRIGTTISGSTKQFDFSFTEPYFMDRNLSAGIDLFHTRSNKQNDASYDELNTGFSIRFGYPLSEYTRQAVSYTLRKNEINNIDATASRFIREQEGKNITSMISQEIVYDVRDSKIEPKNGFVSRFKTDLAGFGGNSKYAKIVVSGAQYYEVLEDYVLKLFGEAGYVKGFGQDVRINDRFFLGSDTLRGFAYAGVGSRDLTNKTRDALGGNSYVRGSAELSMPIAFMPDDLGVKGHIFSDIGVLGRNDETPISGEIFKSDQKPRASIGLGMSWNSPFGLIRLDYAYPILKQSYDELEYLHFSFGTRF